MHKSYRGNALLMKIKGRTEAKMMCMINILETGKCHAVPCWYSTQTREYIVDWRWLYSILSCEVSDDGIFLPRLLRVGCVPTPFSLSTPHSGQSGRLQYFSSRPNWDPPTPWPSHFGSRGGGTHSLAGEGGWGVPIPTRGQTLWFSRYICYVLCASPPPSPF